VVASQAWQAYPQFSPPEQYSPFLLAPGLYYNNAIENFASAMEMSAIAARNSALLAAQHLAAQQQQQQQQQQQRGAGTAAEAA
jgi:prenylcysteine oxidase/farnesylcysteine lyase